MLVSFYTELELEKDIIVTPNDKNGAPKQWCCLSVCLYVCMSVCLLNGLKCIKFGM